MVKNTDTEQLVLLDPHVIYSTSEPEKEKQERINQSLEFLKEINKVIIP